MNVDVIPLGTVIISLLAVVVTIWQARSAKQSAVEAREQVAVMREQVAVMREQLAESRLNVQQRTGDLFAAIRETLSGNVRASRADLRREGVIVITVSEELDDNIIAYLSDLVSQYGYESTIDVVPDLI